MAILPRLTTILGLVFFCHSIAAQIQDSTPYSIACKQYYKFRKGKKRIGVLSDFQADSSRILTTKKGNTWVLLPSSPIQMSQKCKKIAQLKPGLYHNPSLTFGFLLPDWNFFAINYWNEILLDGFGLGYKPFASWRFQHRVTYLDSNNVAYGVFFGVESYFFDGGNRSFSLFEPIIGPKGIQNRFISIPFGLSLQKHLPSREKVHLFLPLDIGVSLQSQAVQNESPTLGFSKVWVEKEVGYFAQFGLGTVFLGKKNQAMSFEANVVLRHLKYKVPGFFSSNIVEDNLNSSLAFRFGLYF